MYLKAISVPDAGRSICVASPNTVLMPHDA